MNPLVEEWLEKAEADFHTAERESRVREYPNNDGVCFHCQQCVEKLLKGYLQARDVYFPKTHNLLALLDLILPFEPLWDSMRPELALLTGYATDFRYPGESATKPEVEKSLKMMRAARTLIEAAIENV